ncbi:MAG: MBL fold metallo-hydrolase [Desulfobacula sp.]|uniref:MBL fold metallo-hydrolase n=1 Tax=Desulfobacula sp. TaxID=2593537 RepID=UPI0025B80932|nr:MBL fold metallo-hydrolase [Desulfobacula sp.]MCD4720827.1 MBL fold metallo-hydrolase [Desulfobacula sp.]
MKDHYIPENKFPIEIDKNIFILGNYFFNLFLIIGDRHSALFEVGISAIVDTVINQLELLNINPDFIISSHPHSDHITGLPGLAKRYPKARIVAAAGAKEFIEHPKAAPLLFKEDMFMSKSLAALNIKPGRPSLEQIPNLDGSWVINDNQSIDLGRITLDLIKVDGHSPGNLIGVLNERKILFCSDSLGFHFPGREYLPLFFTHTGSYLSTLTFIKKFNPSIVCPAHQGPLLGKTAATGIQESLNITVNTINNIKQSTLSDETLAMDLFNQSYKDEFTLYTPENIKNCMGLLVKRAKETKIDFKRYLKNS